MQAEASCWPGQGVCGGPRKGRKTLPAPPILPPGLAVPRGSATLTLKTPGWAGAITRGGCDVAEPSHPRITPAGNSWGDSEQN